MGTEPLTRDLALRIGLAARVLPDVNAAELLQVLVGALGSPLTDEKLRRITVTDLRTALTSVDGEEDTEDTGINKNAMKTAVRYLWGEGIDDQTLPKPDLYKEGDMPNSVRVACCTNGGDAVDGHFGSCPYFYVYQIAESETRLIDVRTTNGADEAEDKNAFRAGLIGDCHVMYVQSIGGPAAAKVVRAGIYPIKMPQGGPIDDALGQLQSILSGSPPPWLAKAIGVPAEQRKRFVVEEA
jgi:nitrogen fixation protein NifX